MMMNNYFPDESLTASEVSAEAGNRVVDHLLSYQEGKLKLCLEIAQLVSSGDREEPYANNVIRASVLTHRLEVRIDTLMKLSVSDLAALKQGYKVR